MLAQILLCNGIFVLDFNGMDKNTANLDLGNALPRRFALHTTLSFFLTAIYGVQVCPFIDSLSPLQWLLPVAAVLMVQVFARVALEKHLLRIDPKRQAGWQLRADLALFVASAVLLGAINTLVYGFPAESGAKLVVGMAAIGFLAASTLSLQRQFALSQALIAQGRHLVPDASPYPVMRQFVWFASLTAIGLLGVIFLVISKDLHWLSGAGQAVPLSSARNAILAELGFVVCILLGYVIAVILAFSRNLAVFLQAENSALAAVGEGDLEARVTVSRNDEFGLMAQGTNAMIKALCEQQETLRVTQDASILSLASLAETRDNETGAHILRTQRYVRALATHLAASERFRDQLDDRTIDLLYKSAPLHDIGKVGIPDRILLKPGKLSEAEFAEMKRHPQIGADALASAEARLGSTSFLKLAREISLTHHEKWDGSGYPNRLSGEEIPLSGRLMALADVYDALISKRVYKPAFSHQKARGIILEGRGTHFDPAVVDAFVAIEHEFQAIASEFGDQLEQAA